MGGKRRERYGISNWERKKPYCGQNLAPASSELAQPMKYHTLTEYGCEVATSAVEFRPVIESADDPLRSPPSINPIHLS
ncbi:hypothetical protein EVAR_58511_1 [Eumeta japonica]|uniref:Uncharacterized protein n=1 Tax=Eumeta variegata TaxID=151549 RepID=A0A4C1Z7N3_EUMVA|nr:hypothetical protein EVAR_58511_1 [Eumeta japonica]